MHENASQALCPAMRPREQWTVVAAAAQEFPGSLSFPGPSRTPSSGIINDPCSVPLFFFFIAWFLSMHKFCLSCYLLNFPDAQGQLQAKQGSHCFYVMSPPQTHRVCVWFPAFLPWWDWLWLFPTCLSFRLPIKRCHSVVSSQVLLFAKGRFVMSLR